MFDCCYSLLSGCAGIVSIGGAALSTTIATLVIFTSARDALGHLVCAKAACLCCITTMMLYMGRPQTQACVLGRSTPRTHHQQALSTIAFCSAVYAESANLAHCNNTTCVGLVDRHHLSWVVCAVRHPPTITPQRDPSSQQPTLAAPQRRPPDSQQSTLTAPMWLPTPQTNVATHTPA